MINKRALKAYLKKKFRNVSQIKIKKLGSGVHGSGFLVEIKTAKGIKLIATPCGLATGLPYYLYYLSFWLVQNRSEGFRVPKHREDDK